jgi:hypothetical protein
MISEEIPLESYITVKRIAWSSWQNPEICGTMKVYVCRLCGCKFGSLNDAKNHLKAIHWRQIKYG